MKENKRNIKRKDVPYASLVDWIVGRSLKSESYYYSLYLASIFVGRILLLCPRLYSSVNYVGRTAFFWLRQQRVPPDELFNSAR